MLVYGGMAYYATLAMHIIAEVVLFRVLPMNVAETGFCRLGILTWDYALRDIGNCLDRGTRLK